MTQIELMGPRMNPIPYLIIDDETLLNWDVVEYDDDNWFISLKEKDGEVILSPYKGKFEPGPSSENICFSVSNFVNLFRKNSITLCEEKCLLEKPMITNYQPIY